MGGDNPLPVPGAAGPAVPSPNPLQLPGTTLPPQFANLPPGTTIKVTPDNLLTLLGLDPPPPIAPPPLPAPSQAPGDIAQSGVVAASGAGVPADLAASTQGDLDRKAHAAEAASKFTSNEANSAAQMQGVGAQATGEQGAQMMQQMLSSLTGALGGAVSGIMGPLTQLPQQAMQAGQSAIQPLMSAVQGAHGAEAALATEPQLVDSVGGEPGSGAGGGGAGIGAGGTTPASAMGPPPVPTSSPPTTPAGAKVPIAPSPGGTTTASGSTGMGGMGMMPPGAMGAGGEGGSKDKPPDKRVTAPGVPNGQPVKGRLTIPPGAPANNSGEGKPTVVTNRPNRRIVIVPTDDEAKE
jgi:hypothetical protein